VVVPNCTAVDSIAVGLAAAFHVVLHVFLHVLLQAVSPLLHGAVFCVYLTAPLKTADGCYLSAEAGSKAADLVEVYLLL